MGGEIVMKSGFRLIELTFHQQCARSCQGIGGLLPICRKSAENSQREGA
jgi:hypothetical protein